MSHITIKDLSEETTLDQIALSELHGGKRGDSTDVSAASGRIDYHYGNNETSFSAVAHVLDINRFATAPPPPPEPKVDQAKW